MLHRSVREMHFAGEDDVSVAGEVSGDFRVRPRLIAIAAGKKGVGQTWLTLTLAQALSQRRARPLVIDADFGLAGTAGIQTGAWSDVDLGAVLRGDVPLTDGIVPVPRGGFDILSGVAGSGVLVGIEAAMIDRLVTRVCADRLAHDHVLFDLGAGEEPAGRQLAALAQTVILVTTEDPASVTEAYALLKRLQQDCGERGKPVDVRIVVNQAASERSGRRTHSALARAARRFLRLNPPLLGLVLRDDSVAETTRVRRLFLSAFPGSPVAGAVHLIARRLLARQGPAPEIRG